jgi:pimeloyl-ACP methyl ester carboxylesterase
MKKGSSLVFLIAFLAAVVILGHRSGNQEPRDAVAAAQQSLGIELRSHDVDVGDLELHVVEAGPEDGPPVVLLHGFPEFWYAWHRQLGQLAAAGFRAIAPDQRGYNASDKPDGVEAYRVERLAGDIAGLIQALGYDRASVAGHDWGGGVAWYLAIHHPERVRKLLIIDTPHPHAFRDFETEEESISWYRTFFQIPWVPEWIGRVANWRILASAMRDTSRPGTFPEETMDLYRSAWDRDGAFSSMVNWYRAAFRYPLQEEGELRVRALTLLVLAPDDAFIPSDVTRRSLPYLDNGRLLELDEGTHWVVQEEPERIGRILIDFFKEP